MANFLTWLSRKRHPYEPLITVEISSSRLINNLREYSRIAPKKGLAPVLKSNAYGHGLIEVAGIIEKEMMSREIPVCPFFVVDSYFEAIALRAGRIKTPLLVIGYSRPETIVNSSLKNISFTISNLETLKSIAGVKKPLSIHLKFDTGMHRQGFPQNEIREVCWIVKANPQITLRGICSHLCDADNSDPAFTKNQILTWNNLVKKMEAEFPSLEYIHLSATDGLRYNREISANVSRLGLGLYGLADIGRYSETDRPNILPVLELKTIITGIKQLKNGQTIGYGNTFKANHDMTIATIPVGYYEGLDVDLSNKGSVEVGQEKAICPIIGRISMNISTIDISHISDPHIGLPVTVISNNPKSPCSIREISKLCDGIPYEIAVHVPAHLKRVID